MKFDAVWNKMNQYRPTWTSGADRRPERVADYDVRVMVKMFYNGETRETLSAIIPLENMDDHELAEVVEDRYGPAAVAFRRCRFCIPVEFNDCGWIYLRGKVVLGASSKILINGVWFPLGEYDDVLEEDD